MNIKPFRLTAGAYLLSGDMRGRREKERERGEIFVKRRAIVWVSLSHTQQKFPFCVMASICLVLFISLPTPPTAVPWPHAKIIINILLITSQMCCSQDCIGKKDTHTHTHKRRGWMGNQWKGRVHKSLWLYWVLLKNMFGLGSNIKELPKSQ